MRKPARHFRALLSTFHTTAGADHSARVRVGMNGIEKGSHVITVTDPVNLNGHKPCPMTLRRRIAEMLVSALPSVRHQIIAGAGHMAPLTHAPQTNAPVGSFIRNAAPADGFPAAAVANLAAADVSAGNA